MENKCFKGKSNIYNMLSILVLILFVVLELTYSKVFFDNDLMSLVDSFPQNVIQMLSANDDKEIIEESSDVEESIEETKIRRRNFSANYRIATVSELYFEDTLFIGDSRMHGFSIYRKLPGATYYCYQSASAFTILEKEHEVEGIGNITLSDLLCLKRFDKIYISLGINNVGAGLENHRNHYKNLLDYVLKWQPDAIIYLLGNLHVTAELKSDMIYLNNETINNINAFISQFADRRQIFYFDPNEVYDDEFGNMNSELSYDQSHIYLRHYDRLLYFLITHAVVYDE